MKKNSQFKKMIFYALIGSFCALVDTGVFAGLTYIFNVNAFVANFISVNMGILCSFLLNAYLNFKKTNSLGKRAIIFWIVGYIGLLLSMLILYIGLIIFPSNELISKIISVVLVALFQYLINSRITFSDKF